MACPIARIALDTLSQTFEACVPLTRAPSPRCSWDAGGFARCTACRNATKQCHAPVCSRNRCLAFPAAAKVENEWVEVARNCSLSRCFDPRPPCQKRPLPLFVYSADSFRLDQMFLTGDFLPWGREPARNFRLVDEPADACLLIVHASSAIREHIHPMPPDHPRPDWLPIVRPAADERTRIGTKWWQGGLNHVLWDPNHWDPMHNGQSWTPDAPFLPTRHIESPRGGWGLYDTGLASLAPSSAIKSTSAAHFDTMLFLTPKSSEAVVPDAWAPLTQEPDSRPLLLSFRGSVPCWGTRWYQHRLLAANYLHGLKFPSGRIVVDVACPDGLAAMLYRKVRTGEWTGYAEGTIGYGELLRTSKFGLAAGGHAPTSYRFAELMIAGVVPVVPDDGEVLLPFEPEVSWDKCVVRVPEAHMLQLGSTLDRIVRSGELPSRRAACAQLNQRVLGAGVDDQGAPIQQVGPRANTFRAAFEEMVRVWEHRLDRLAGQHGAGGHHGPAAHHAAGGQHEGHHGQEPRAGGGKRR